MGARADAASATAREVAGGDPRGVPARFGALYRRGLVSNVIGGALAFVYLSYISSPRPPPPHDEALLFAGVAPAYMLAGERKRTRLNSSHANISKAGFCLKKKK